MKFVSRAVVDQNKEEEIVRDGEPESMTFANLQWSWWICNKDSYSFAKGSSTNAPQEDYDPRTLYERLQEQKNIKEELFQEQTRLSNLIKRVDDEEAEYYQTLSDVQEKLDIEQKEKEREELEAFRRCVDLLWNHFRFTMVEYTVRAVEQQRSTSTTTTEPPTTVNTKPSTSTANNATRRKSSKNALDGLVVVKKKRSADEKNDDDSDEQPEAKKPKPTEQKTSKESAGSNTLSSLMAAYSSDSEDE